VTDVQGKWIPYIIKSVTSELTSCICIDPFIKFSRTRPQREISYNQYQLGFAYYIRNHIFKSQPRYRQRVFKPEISRAVQFWGSWCWHTALKTIRIYFNSWYSEWTRVAVCSRPTFGSTRLESRPGNLLPWGFTWFASVPRGKYRDSTSVRPRSIPLKSSPAYHSALYSRSTDSAVK
jgi:hypothetical protein